MAASTWVWATSLAVGGVLAVLAVSAAFYAVGRSEDRERESRERERED